MLVVKRWTGKNADALVRGEDNNGLHAKGQRTRFLLCIILHKKKRLHVSVPLGRKDTVSSGYAVSEGLRRGVGCSHIHRFTQGYRKTCPTMTEKLLSIIRDKLW